MLIVREFIALNLGIIFNSFHFKVKTTDKFTIASKSLRLVAAEFPEIPKFVGVVPSNLHEQARSNRLDGSEIVLKVKPNVIGKSGLSFAWHVPNLTYNCSHRLQLKLLL